MMTDDNGESKGSWTFLADPDAVKKRAMVDMSGLAAIHEFHNYLVTGEWQTHYLRYFGDRYFRNVKPVIASLGCGNGHLERVMATEPSVSFPYTRIDGFELNPDLVRYATEEASKLAIRGIQYFAMDLNEPTLGHTEYDLVIFFHSLHHVTNLERCLDAVGAALKDDGYLLVVDFVGPTRFQWTDKQLHYAQMLLDLLPQGLKVDLRIESDKPVFKDKVRRPAVEDVARADPSEAVRSGDIMTLLCSRFHPVEEKPLGGTLLSLVFDGIAGNFDESNPYIRSLILSFARFEESLIKEGILTKDYVFMVLTKMKNRRRPRWWRRFLG